MEKTKIFKPTEKFLDIYNTLMFSEVSQILLEGAVRSGKSYTRNFVSLAFIKKLKSPRNILVSGRTSGTVKQNVLSEWERLLGNKEFKRRNDANGEYFIIPLKGFENKKIYIRGRLKETDYKKIQGMTLDFWYCDERTNQHKSFFDMALTRLSLAHSKCILTCNPSSPYHFLKTDFIDKVTTDKIKSKYFKSYKFLFEDNPSLGKRYKETIKNSLTGVDFDRLIKGLWVLADGLIYKCFDKNLNVKKFTQEEIENLKRNGTIFIGCDYGTLNATVFLKFVKINNIFYLIDEYYYSGRESEVQKTTREYVLEMQKFIGNDKVKNIIIDPSASYFKTDLIKNNIKQILNRKNEVLRGIRKTRNEISNKNIIINEKCKSTIKELECYSWDTKASLKGEDIPLKVNDHRMDALRYVIYTIPSNLDKNNGYY